MTLEEDCALRRCIRRKDQSCDIQIQIHSPAFYLSPYGLNLSITHPSPSFTYANRSCNLLALPCQNSILSGITLMPPQKSGTGISSLPSNLSSTIFTLCSKCSRFGNTLLCSLAHAPQPTPTYPCVIVYLTLLTRKSFHRALHPHLPLQLLPPERKRGVGIRAYIFTFA